MYTESLKDKIIITPNNRMAEQLVLSITKQDMIDTGKSIASFYPQFSLLVYNHRLYSRL